jgi:beta-phosphoglucomutase
MRAVIFDMDGVLVDSYAAHLASWQALAAEQGLRFGEDDFRATFGRTSREIMQATWGDRVREEEIGRLDARKEALYRDRIREAFPAMPGAAELIDALAEAGFRLAVGSSGPPENVALALERLGRAERFAAKVTGADVERGKPDPQVFRLAGERLGVPPSGCIVVEDAPDGIVAARAAGMACVAVLSRGRAAADFRESPADLTVERLADLSVESLSGLLG